MRAKNADLLTPDAWLRSGAYLPDFMRDFHDQKELFKALQEVVERSNQKNSDQNNMTLTWVDAHIYTVDIFLWVMARHGYTLQRSRQRFAFSDISEFVGASTRRLRETSAAILRHAFAAPPTQGERDG